MQAISSPKYSVGTPRSSRRNSSATRDRASSVSRNKVQDFQLLLLKMERAADEFWHFVEGWTQSLSVNLKREIDDPVKTFGSLRKYYSVSLDVYNRLKTSLEIWISKANRFGTAIEGFGSQINAAALSCGLQRLPNELLMQVLGHAAKSLKRTVTLSHVCGRFRSLILSSRKLWAPFGLISDWTPQQILAIAERSGFQSLDAVIWTHPQASRLKDSARTILGLHEHLEELRIYDLNTSVAREVQDCLTGSEMTSLRTLYISHVWEEDSITSMRLLEFCRVPSLQTLEVDFIPHPSLSGRLVRCILTLSDDVLLKDLLAFLSDANHLQELSVSIMGGFVDQDNPRSLSPITLPKLSSVRIDVESTESSSSARMFLKKIIPFSVQKMGIHVRSEHIDAIAFLSFVQARPSVRELEIRLPSWYDVDLYIPFGAVPQNVETLSLKGGVGRTVSRWARNSGTFRARCLQVLRFDSCGGLPMPAVLRVRDFFQSVGFGKIRFEFFACDGVRDGTFELDDVECAFSGD